MVGVDEGKEPGFFLAMRVQEIPAGEEKERWIGGV